MSEKNDLTYIVFLNDKGYAEVTIKELLRSFDEDRKLFLMNYKGPRSFFTGRVDPCVMNREEIDRAIDAYEHFKGGYIFPPKYLET
jgi:hypothetical protein